VSRRTLSALIALLILATIAVVLSAEARPRDRRRPVMVLAVNEDAGAVDAADAAPDAAAPDAAAPDAAEGPGYLSFEAVGFEAVGF